MGGIELLARFARILAVALTACGLFLIFLDIGPKPETSRLRRRLATLWRALSGLPISAVPGFVVSAAADAVDRFVVYWYEQSARNVATAGTFTLIVFIAS